MGSNVSSKVILLCCTLIWQFSKQLQFLTVLSCAILLQTKNSSFRNSIPKSATRQNKRGLKKTGSLLSTHCQMSLYKPSPLIVCFLLHKSHKVSYKVFGILSNSLTFMLRTGKDTFTAHYQLPPLVLTLSQGLAYLNSIDREIYGLSNTLTLLVPKDYLVFPFV